jgi:hypothetical protein
MKENYGVKISFEYGGGAFRVPKVGNGSLSAPYGREVVMPQ